MIASLALGAILLVEKGPFEHGRAPMSPQTFVLMQSFTEPGESEPADSIVFDQEFKARAIDSGFAIEEK